MPHKVKTVSYYACGICNREDFTTYQAAKECHDSGIALPEYFAGMVVQLSHKGNFYDGALAVIHRDTWTSEESDAYDHHRLPEYYEVYVGQTNLLTLKVENIKTVDFTGERCPLCTSKKLSVFDTPNEDDEENDQYEPYLTFDIGLSNVRMSRCSRCKHEFFTSDQAKVVKGMIEDQAKKVLKSHIRTKEELEANPRGKYYW